MSESSTISERFPATGGHSLSQLSPCGRFGLYCADRFGKRGPAAATPYYVFDSLKKKGFNARTKAHAAAWVAFQTDGTEYLPWFSRASTKAPPVDWQPV